ncbi:flavin reductase [Colwellia sp. 6_MG-2023]|uniref:flavin reductase family protein n=1 Tax=Colwellia sp. 6_MG-2023 TaxID=3062676 RepID=UPI0026E37046|nr:flavin reductase [Colwellia sp. 6_MG-2023]MDO6489246.1 flavin reductase [Colwellia sp. 6_MG-2023]
MADSYRAKLINSLSGFKSANLIGTVNKQGQTNLAMFSSVVHLGASPALIGFITRPHIVTRHTLENILQTKQYTINQVNKNIWRSAHQTSARYDADQCEFKHTGLTPMFIDEVNAPFVKESLLKYALTLEEIIPVAANNTQLVIGKVTNIICEPHAIRKDGYIDIESLETVSISGLDSYHVTERLSRLSYAKKDKLPEELSIDGDRLSKQ